jgi:hypothetical protein
LRKSLNGAFVSLKFENIHISIDFQKEFKHVNFVAFLITGIKNELKSKKTIYFIIKLSQTSLDNPGREHIKIFDLLDFEQKFIDSLILGMSFMETIFNKTIKQLYIERKREENTGNYYIEVQKRFSFSTTKRTFRERSSEAVEGLPDRRNDENALKSPFQTISIELHI